MVPAFISVVRGSMREGSPTNKMNDGYRQNIMIESIKRFCFWAVLSFLVGGTTTQCLCATPTRAGGSYVTRPKNVLGMNYLFEVRSNISHFMKVALDGKSFNKALQYKTDTKFIEALEDGLLADNQAIRAINEKPELVDEYHSFYTQTKGTLAEFLSKGLAKWLDGLPPGLKSDIGDINSDLGRLFANATDAKKRAELVDAWKALNNIGVDDVIRKNPDYLKNIDDYAKRSGKNADEVADLAKNNENGIEQFLDELGASSSGVWSQNPFKRGQDIEQALGHNLPGNFPVIDKFENGLATSIKTIDLNAKTYQDVTKLEYRLKNYVDKVAGFNGQTWAEVVIKSSDVKTRALDLAIPFNGSTAQQGILNQIVNYGTSKGVTVNIIIYP